MTAIPPVPTRSSFAVRANARRLVMRTKSARKPRAATNARVSHRFERRVRQTVAIEFIDVIAAVVLEIDVGVVGVVVRKSRISVKSKRIQI